MNETQTKPTPPTVSPAPKRGFRGHVRSAIWKVRCENRFVSRYAFSLGAVRAFRETPGVLNPGAEKALEGLEADGVALVPAAGLVGDDTLAAAVQRVRDLVAAQQTAIDDRRRGLVEPSASGTPKTFLVELLGRAPSVAGDDPLLALALHPQLMGVAEHYAQCRLRLHDLNVWLNLASEAEATTSQLWHRDLPEDHDIVKCFVYVDDVPAGAGPLQYYPGTHTDSGLKVKLAQTWDGVGWRISDETLAAAFPDSEVVTAAGVAGTAAFADTRGIHRGGHAVTADRLVIQIMYSSPATTRPRILRPDGPAAAAEPRVAWLGA